MLRLWVCVPLLWIVEQKRVNVAKHFGADTCIDYIQSKDLVYDVKAAPLDGLGSHSALILTANKAVHWWNSVEQGLSKLQSRWFRLASCLMCLI